MNNQYYGVHLRIVSKNGKCVFEVKCNKLIHLMAINLAFFRFVHKIDFNQEVPITLDWISNFSINIQDESILYRWRVKDPLDKKYLYSGIVKVFQSEKKPETDFRLNDERLKVINFKDLSLSVAKKFVVWTNEDWDIGLTLLLFASQIPDHIFWRDE